MRVLVRALVLVPLVAWPGASFAQEAPPPIAVPTEPVPQGPPPPAKPPAAKPAPKPAPAPAPPPKSEPKPGTDTGKSDEPKSPPVYNNEGVFKISGTKGSGTKGSGATGGKTSPKTKTSKAKAGGPVAEWPGFRMLENGGSEVMVEFTKDPGMPTEHRAAGSIRYVWKGAHVARSNNTNPLITIHFDTPVASARLEPKKGELDLVIDLRPGVNVTTNAALRAPGDGEGRQFYVQFPAGSYLPKGGVGEEPAPTQKIKLKGKPGETPAAGEEKPAAPPQGNAPKPPANGGSKTGPKE